MNGRELRLLRARILEMPLGPEREALLSLLPRQQTPEGWTARTWVGFYERNVPPDVSVMLSVRPQRSFRGDRIAVWSRIAPSFIIEAVRVGVSFAGICAGDVPADVFSVRLDMLAHLDAVLSANGSVRVTIDELAIDVFGQEVVMPCAMPGMDVILQVRNIDDVHRSFGAAILGTTPDD